MRLGRCWVSLGSEGCLRTKPSMATSTSSGTRHRGGRNYSLQTMRATCRASIPISMTKEKEPKMNSSDDDNLLQFFEFGHLPPHLAEVSKPFFQLAGNLMYLVPQNEERRMALRKLLEAKDCAVRAKLF